MNIVSITVSAGMMGMLLPGVMNMSIAPAVASIRSNNFAAAEAQVVAYAAKANVSYEAPKRPENCRFDHETKPTEITCWEGVGKYKMIAKRSFLLMDTPGSGLGVYSDDDRDGFDDVTGLFTHYAECYSGWKGQGSLKNNCDVGGRYVIPAYAHLYY